MYNNEIKYCNFDQVTNKSKAVTFEIDLSLSASHAVMISANANELD